MPDLPTITVTATQAQRCLAAYGDALAYRAWLRAAVKDYVLAHEARQIDEANNTAKRDALAAAEQALNL